MLRHYQVNTLYLNSIRNLDFSLTFSVITKQAIIVGFKKWTKGFKLLLYYFFFKFISKDVKLLHIYPRTNFFFTNNFVNLFDKFLIQICLWVLLNHLKYKKDYFLVSDKVGSFSVIFTNLTFLKYFFNFINIDLRTLQNFLDSLVFCITFKFKFFEINYQTFLDFSKRLNILFIGLKR